MTGPPRRISRRVPAAIVAMATAITGTPVAAQGLDIGLPPGAELVQSSTPAAGGHVLATAPWTEQGLPTRSLSGAVLRETWRVEAPSISVQGLAAALAEDIAASGFDILLSCHSAQCGGFDFRAAMDLGPSPEMYVDIGNYSYVSAVLPEGETGIAITVSASGPVLYIHAAQIAPQGDAPLRATSAPTTPDIPPADVQDNAIDSSMAERIASLPERGAVTLDDLSFRTGASELSGRDYPSLMALAAFLAENPDRRIMLVGHTDSQGSLEGNVRLSEDRATAVRAHLVDELGVDPARVDATGIGFLAPRAGNDTPGGREANRRVEAVLLSAP